MTERAAAGARDDAAEPTAPRRGRRWGRIIAVALAPVLLSSPWWGPSALSRLAFFQVRRVEIDGVRYLTPGEIVARLAVDTTRSVWDDLEPLERRVAEMPQVGAVRIERKLPGTLRVVVTEKVPVALVPSRDGFDVYDVDGTRLPIDPSRVARLDVPVVSVADSSLLRLLGAVRADQPRLFARLSELRRVGKDELLLRITRVTSWSGLTVDTAAPRQVTLPVRAMADVTVSRLADIFPVEHDLARRQARVAEIDLRYRDQVIARLQ